MASNPPDERDALESLSNLDDPLRRRLYRHVADADVPVSRDDAATTVGIGRTLAAYHLDKLADAGLLDIHYQRPCGRGGPGAGRPAKMYTRATGEISVSVPPRDYLLLAQLLVESLEFDAGVRTVVNDAAFDAGRRAGDASGRDIIEALHSCGYQPRVVDDGRIELRNCPFHVVAQDHTEVVCGLNLRLVEGVLAGCVAKKARAELDPHPKRCCVVIDGARARQPKR
ncbi:MAG: helix-turn-helix domain-containing protein [Mycobacteriaceae bacterium]|nr:helix-turn-helix domain-containing protein [Mycobacteriaceae bacterium]